MNLKIFFVKYVDTREETEAQTVASFTFMHPFDLHTSTNIAISIPKDEYGTAAYKTCEIDAFLDDAAVQHREVQNHESQLFKDYFDKLE